MSSNLTLESIVKKSVTYFLDAAENTIMETRLLTEFDVNNSSSVLSQLKEANMLTPRLSALLSTKEEMRNEACSRCGEINWNIDCPTAVCKTCAKEVYVESPEAEEYCRSCSGFKVGDCPSIHIINKSKEGTNKNEPETIMHDSIQTKELGEESIHEPSEGIDTNDNIGERNIKKDI